MMATANYFALGLTLTTLITGFFWLLMLFKGTAQAATPGVDNWQSSGRIRQLPAWLVWCGELFPMLLLVLVVRSFIYEAYKIPSGSMMPTLWVGDFILVKKFAYGLREPIFQKKLLGTGKPQRGDVAVFKYPEDPSIYFIKRVVGLPGDKVIYRGKQLLIQSAKVSSALNKTTTVKIDYQKAVPPYSLAKDLEKQGLLMLTEQLGDRSYQILASSHPHDHALYYRQSGEPLLEWVVPPDHYFVMGDNRDNSRDSRFWGFVPDDHLVGQAVVIWMSLEKQPDCWPTGIRWRRLGAIR